MSSMHELHASQSNHRFRAHPSAGFLASRLVPLVAGRSDYEDDGTMFSVAFGGLSRKQIDDFASRARQPALTAFRLAFVLVSFFLIQGRQLGAERDPQPVLADQTHRHSADRDCHV